MCVGELHAQIPDPSDGADSAEAGPGQTGQRRRLLQRPLRHPGTDRGAGRQAGEDPDQIQRVLDRVRDLSQSTTLTSDLILCKFVKILADLA